MSSFMQAIVSELGGAGLNQLASSLGTSESQTQTAIAAALPALIGGLAKNAAQPSGAQALASALDRDHQAPLGESLGGVASMLGALTGGSGGGGMLGAAMNMMGGGQQQGGMGSLLGAAMGLMGGQGQQAAPKALDGMGILGHIFGGQQQQVQQGVAQASGLDVGAIAKLLPALAPVVMSALGTMKQKQGMDANSLAGFLQTEQQVVSDKSAGGGILDALDAGGDGIADDLLRIGMGVQQSGLLGKLFG